MATASSSNKAIDKTPQKNWIEFKLLQTIIQSRLGQTVLKLVDYFLCTVEKCTEWSLPRQKVEDEKDSGKMELVRPLPWLLFLPSLMILRIIRMTVNVGASILRYPKITPSKMIKLVQKSRGYLHDTMKKEKKERYELKDKRSSMNGAKKALIRSIRLTLSSLSCLDTSKSSPSPSPIKVYVSSNLDPNSITTTSKEKSVVESMDSTATLKNSTSESEEGKQETEGNKKKETLNEEIDLWRIELGNSEDDEDERHNCWLNSFTISDDSNDSLSNSNQTIYSNEIRDIIEDDITFKKKDIELFLNAEQTSMLAAEQKKESTYGKRLSAKESCNKVEERLATSQRIDSSDCCTSDNQESDPTFYSSISSDSDTSKKPSMSIAEQCVSRKILKTKEFINGETQFIPASTISESKSRQTNNTVVKKRSKNVSKSKHKGKRTNRNRKKK